MKIKKFCESFFPKNHFDIRMKLKNVNNSKVEFLYGLFLSYKKVHIFVKKFDVVHWYFSLTISCDL